MGFSPNVKRLIRSICLMESVGWNATGQSQQQHSGLGAEVPLHCTLEQLPAVQHAPTPRQKSLGQRAWSRVQVRATEMSGSATERHAEFW